MSILNETNPYTLIREIIDLYGGLYSDDLSWEYNDLDMSMCKEDINEIEQKHQKLKEWIKEKEGENEKCPY